MKRAIKYGLGVIVGLLVLAAILAPNDNTNTTSSRNTTSTDSGNKRDTANRPRPLTTSRFARLAHRALANRAQITRTSCSSQLCTLEAQLPAGAVNEQGRETALGDALASARTIFADAKDRPGPDRIRLKFTGYEPGLGTISVGDYLCVRDNWDELAGGGTTNPSDALGDFTIYCTPQL